MNFLNKNVGRTDQILRIGCGLLMIYFGFIDDSVITDRIASILLRSFGVIIFATGIFTRCPLYTLIDLNTCNKDNS